MEWLISLFADNSTIAHDVVVYALVIAFGVLLGKIKFFGVSLGVTFVLFVGILAGHIGFNIGNMMLLNFLRDFGLILFVFSIGMQVGPGFFSSFKKGGMQMNLIAALTILLNVVVAVAIYYMDSELTDPGELPADYPRAAFYFLCRTAVCNVHAHLCRRFPGCHLHRISPLPGK